MRTRLYLPALFRLFRLQRHGSGFGIYAWPEAAAEFQFSLSGHRHCGLLEALAYIALHGPARLSLHSAGRRPRSYMEDVSEPDDHDVTRRPVARSQLDLRFLGRIPRNVIVCEPDLEP